jgi:hypothetical protein
VSEEKSINLTKSGTSNGGIKRVAFVGNYVPRQCGSATFTTDLCEAFAGKSSIPF